MSSKEIEPVIKNNKNYFWLFLIITLILSGIGYAFYVKKPLKDSFYVYPSKISNTLEFSCSGVKSVSLTPNPTFDKSISYVRMLGEVSSDTNRLAIKIVKDSSDKKILQFLTGASIDFGEMEPAKLMVVKDEDTIIAIGVETADAGNTITHTIMINKENGLGIWTKTNEMFLEPYPYSVTSYLKCL